MSRCGVVYLRVLLALIAACMAAAPPVCSAKKAMSYTLLEGSTLTDEVGLAPPIVVPLRGTFLLVLREINPLFTLYDVQEVKFQSQGGVWQYLATGEGTYQIGGEVALEQRMQLEVQINDVSNIELESGELAEERVWPMVEVYLSQEQVDPLRVFSMHLIAAPVREIWFSTGTGFTSGTLKQTISPGDLLSDTGRVVRKNLDLAGRLGIMPIVPDLGLDAFDVAPGGEILFSVEEDVHSETLSHLQHGDLLSDRGRIVRTNQELTSAFSPQPPAPDVGLNAVQMMHDGEILFSIEEELFSETLGVVLRPGDLLSDKGVIVRTKEELLANFEPLEGQSDMGLDAVHVWPGGEIWFSTEVSFQSKTLGEVGDGDLLSDGGWIVFRNLELVQHFGPLEDLGDFGLDSLFVVIEQCLAAPSTREIELKMDESSGDLRIEWQSDGRLFQVERADDPGGPYVAVAPISPEQVYIDTAALSKKKSFYRIREW